jgi:hypothetical protein
VLLDIDHFTTVNGAITAKAEVVRNQDKIRRRVFQALREERAHGRRRLGRHQALIGWG